MTESGIKEFPSVINGLSIQKLKIREICGVHPEIKRIWSESGALDPINDPIPRISSVDSELYTAMNPISLHSYKKKLYVVANISAYRAACQLGDHNIYVYTYIFEQRMNKKIRELIRNELLIYPSLNKKSFHPAYIYLIHKWMIASNNYNGIDRVPNSKCGFARWIGCDVRKLG